MFSKLAALTIGLLLSLGLAVSASAYPVQDPDASVSSTTVAPGGTVTFTAGGFGPGTPVTVTAVRTDGEAAGAVDLVAAGTGRMGAGLVVVRSATKTFDAVADSNGSVSVPVSLGAAGTWTITASGVDADGNPLSVSSTVLVSTDAPVAGTPAGSGSGSNGGVLARTGVDSVATTLWVGFGVLVLGGVLVAVASGRGRTRQDA